MGLPYLPELVKWVVRSQRSNLKKRTETIQRSEQTRGFLAGDGLESLEPRILLSASITDLQREALHDGLDGLIDQAAVIEGLGEVAQPLPYIDASVGSFVDIDGTLNEKLFNPLFDVATGLFTVSPNASVDDVVATLEAQDGVSQVTSIQNNDEIRFSLLIKDQQTTPGVALGLSQQATDIGLGLEGPVAVDLQTDLEFEFSFGIDLTDGAVDNGDFFFQPDGDLVLEATVNHSDINAPLGFGLVDLTVQDGEAQLEAQYNITWNNPDADPAGHITLQELQNTPTDELLTVQATGQGEVQLPVDEDFLPFSVGGDPKITVNSDNLFDSAAEVIEFNTDFDPIQQFNEDLKQAVLDGLVAQVDLTGQMQQSGQLGQNIFLIGGSIGESLDIGSILDDHIAQPAGAYLAGDNATLDGLIDVLNAQNGVFGDLTFTLNADGQLVGDELLVNLTINAQRITPDVELGLGDDIDGILTAEGLTAELVTTLDWQVSVGVDLNALPSVVDAVFARYASPMAVTADLALPDVVFDAQAGFLGLSFGNVGGQASSLSLDVDLTVDVNNPDADVDGNVTLAELQSTSFDALVTQAGTAQVDIDLFGLSGLDGVANDPTDPAAIHLSDDLFDDQDADFVHNFESQGILDFANTDANTVRQLLTQFEEFLRNFTASSAFKRQSPAHTR